MFDFKKIIVIGCSGGGKSTFSKQLAEITGFPLYHLDNVYWQPDTSHLQRPEFIRRQKEIMKTERWIIDGNYGKTIKYRVKECDLVFFFDIPPEVCIEGVLSRDRSRDDIACELEPNEELLEFIRNYRKNSRPKVLRLLKNHPEITVVTFKSRDEADGYLEKLRRELWI